MQRFASLLLLGSLIALPAHARDYSGENPVNVPPEQMARIQTTLDLIYARDYAKAVRESAYMSDDYPASPIGPIGQSLVWQSRMLENYDFRYEDEYYAQYQQSIDRLDVAMKDSSMKAWNLFMLGGTVGLEAIQQARKGEYMKALNKGWEALESMKKAHRMNKEFKDPLLGLGIYNYWRTVFTSSVKYLPFFPDKRDEGVAQMKTSRDKGLIARVGASLSLAYTHLEARDYAAAEAEIKPLVKEFPNSIIGRQVLGRIYKKQRNYDDAAQQFKQCLKIDPSNNYALLYLGEIYYATRKHNLSAEDYYERFLKTKAPRDQKALANYRLGAIARRFDYVNEAIGHYEKALALNPKMKRAEKRLDEMKKRKAQGKGKSRPDRSRDQSR